MSLYENEAARLPSIVTVEQDLGLAPTGVQLVFNPFSQFAPQLELYSQLQLSLWSDPIAFSVPKSTW